MAHESLRTAGLGLGFRFSFRV